ncbi:hypothetical protein D1872_264020 [compost metagenome]
MQGGNFRRGDDLHAGGHQVLDAVLMGAELVAAVNQRDLLGDRLQHERPVHRGIASAADQDPAALEAAEIADEIVQVALLEFGRVLQLKPPWFKSADPRRNDQGPCVVDFLVGGDDKMTLILLLDTQYFFFKTYVRIEPFQLLIQVVDQFLARNLGKSGDIVNIFLWVKGGNLSSQLRHTFD